jgi:hypothetical protein
MGCGGSVEQTGNQGDGHKPAAAVTVTVNARTGDADVDHDAGNVHPAPVNPLGAIAGAASAAAHAAADSADSQINSASASTNAAASSANAAAAGAAHAASDAMASAAVQAASAANAAQASANAGANAAATTAADAKTATAGKISAEYNTAHGALSAKLAAGAEQAAAMRTQAAAALRESLAPFHAYIDAHKACKRCNPAPIAAGSDVLQCASGDDAAALFPEGPTKASTLVKSAGAKPVTLFVVNECGEAIHLSWVGSDGVPAAPGDIGAGASAGMSSAIGHQFVVSTSAAAGASKIIAVLSVAAAATEGDEVEIVVDKTGVKTAKGKRSGADFAVNVLDQNEYGGVNRSADGKTVRKCDAHAVCINPACKGKGKALSTAMSPSAWRCRLCSAPEHPAAEALFVCGDCRGYVCAQVCLGPALAQCPKHGVLTKTATTTDAGDCAVCRGALPGGQPLRYCAECYSAAQSSGDYSKQFNCHIGHCEISDKLKSARDCFSCGSGKGYTVRTECKQRFLCTNPKCGQLWKEGSQVAVCLTCRAYMCGDDCKGPGARFCDVAGCTQQLALAYATGLWRCHFCDTEHKGAGGEMLLCSKHGYLRCADKCDGVAPTPCPLGHGPMMRFGTLRGKKRSCANCHDVLGAGTRVRACGTCLAVAHSQPCPKRAPRPVAAGAAAIDRGWSSDEEDFAMEPEMLAQFVAAAEANVKSATTKSCDLCAGSGRRVCAPCGGKGARAGGRDHFGAARTVEKPCAGGCGGSGKVPCFRCGGTGAVF